MKMYRYLWCGFEVEADLPLPGLGPRDAADAAPAEIVIERGRVPEALGAAGERRFPNWMAAPGELLLDVPHVARFYISGGSRIVYEPALGCLAADFAVFLMGSAFGSVVHQRGCLVLHGSAVEVDGGAVLFCGASGRGKSSLAAALSLAGYPLIADDVCAVRLEGDRPVLCPDGRALKLWADVVRHLNVPSGEPVRRGLEKFWVRPVAAASADRIPVRRIYFLRDAQPPHRAGIEEFGLLDGATLLGSAAYRPKLVRVWGQQAGWLQQSVRLLSHAGAFRLTRERRLEALPQTLAMLEEHWRQTERKASHAAA